MRKPFILKSKFWLLLLLGFIFNSCETKQAKKESRGYFDLKSFIESQAEKLTSEKIKLKKFVTKTGKTEEKLFEQVNWEEELKPFAECDINKPSLKNSYSIDSSLERGILCIIYSAKESSTKIRKVNICLEHDSITLINIEKKTDNLYYGYSTSLNYFPLKGYSITTSQKITFTKETMLEIKALFLK
jgi:hypothetical protein